ncbi:MAG: hypothetical protein A3I68_07150 [Candidatus Melainabacteria bacterium RIFCSPLOWO2_02_FULL_35_15]|nr:MAG: hypothetical protein A3F80_04650 [Candidatus Melainabacteria bacterium RIFCSPLOWO2_12_FULL_35_11]OGI13565.1 MAG: hypothetical protein A3I68_07150 [Candidatus Melainabacteria bacterium RIFCSPLOWO2_02_FULL_35_15]
MNFSGISLLLLRLAISYVWLSAGLSKLFNSQFINTFSDTLNGFAKGTHYVFYADFLNNYVIPHAQIFAQFTIWGEILTGIAFLLGFPLFLAVAVGIFMNLNYYFVATAVPSQFLNLIMIFSQFAAYGNNAGSFWGLSASLKK